MVNLLDLPFVSGVGTRTIVGEGFGAGEFVVGGGCCDNVAVAGYLTCETLDWARYWGIGQ